MLALAGRPALPRRLKRFDSHAVPWVALNSTDAWSLFVSDVTLWVIRLSHQTVSATQPWRVNNSRRVCCKSWSATSHVIHTVCSFLSVVTCCSLTYGNVNEALHGLCACFQRTRVGVHRRCSFSHLQWSHWEDVRVRLQRNEKIWWLLSPRRYPPPKQNFKRWYSYVDVVYV